VGLADVAGLVRWLLAGDLMAGSTGPILAVGAITVGNRVIVQGQEMDWRIPVATGVAAMAAALLERVWARGVVSIAWLALIASLFVRVDDRTPSPIESFQKWYQQGR
jgi:predicted metal-binding membrane protein